MPWQEKNARGKPISWQAEARVSIVSGMWKPLIKQMVDVDLQLECGGKTTVDVAVKIN